MPNTSADSDWQCSMYGKDSCSINHHNISKEDIFYIGIQCPMNSCIFDLKIFLTPEVELEDGVEFQIEFAKDESKIFKF